MTKAKQKSIINYTPGRLYQIKLRGKRGAKGRISLYLDHYTGQNREFEFLNIIVKDNPETPEERDYNREQLALAHAIREKRETHLKHASEGLISPAMKNLNFLDYYQAYLNAYPNKDIRLVRYSLEKFRIFLGKSKISPHEITPELVIKFKNFLQENLRGETPLNYYTKFKAVCKKAVKERVFSDNPCEGITMPRDNSVRKAILSYKEMSLLAQTDFNIHSIRDAFLFACNTALGFSELKAMRWGDIDFAAKKLTFQRQKVKNTSSRSINHLDLNTNALRILGEPGEPDSFVFDLKSYTSASQGLKRWAKKAGITKNITWHSARHSVATNLLSSGVDLKTVSSVLTHASIKHTGKYLHLVDEIKKQALESIPDFMRKEEH